MCDAQAATGSCEMKSCGRQAVTSTSQQGNQLLLLSPADSQTDSACSIRDKNTKK